MMYSCVDDVFVCGLCLRVCLVCSCVDGVFVCG
jgi:hypothetical protein